MNTFLPYVFTLLVAIAGGLYRNKYRDRASKVLTILLVLTLASEVVAAWAGRKYGNNMFVYHFFAPLQLIFLGLYFDNSVESFRKRRWGLVIGSVSVLLAVVNAVYFQSLKTLNSNFLLFEGLIVMGMVLFTFQRILNDDKVDIYRNPHFWFNVIFIFFWSCTYTIWALYAVLQDLQPIAYYVYKIIWVVNLCTYLSIGIVFFYFSNKGVRA